MQQKLHASFTRKPALYVEFIWVSGYAIISKESLILLETGHHALAGQALEPVEHYTLHIKHYIVCLH